MYAFKPWTKGNVTRFYISPAPEGSYVYLHQGILKVFSNDAAFAQTVYDFLVLHLGDFIKTTSLKNDEIPLIFSKLPSPYAVKTNTRIRAQNERQPKQKTLSTGMPRTAAINATLHHADTIKMDAKTLKNVVGTIDTRESAETIRWYMDGAIRCQRNTLEIGDIQFENVADKTLLIFERKTIADFRQSIISAHAHSQAERLYQMAEQRRAEGWRVMVCWLVIESDTETLYDTLPDTNRVDGMINYLSGILGQYVFTAFHDQHGAYLVNKLVQGFNELKLTYPVKNASGQRVDIPKKAMKIAPPSGAVDHNVSTAETNQLLYVLTAFSSINMRVAKALAATGKPLREILQMTEPELKTIDGIGPTLAKRILAEFSI